MHLCKGDIDQNFAVSPTNGSTYLWTMSSNVATITSGNGTEHILIDLNDTGMFWLYVQETDVNMCTSKDSILIEVHSLPTPFIYSIGDTEFCEGDFVSLVADSMYSLVIWNHGINTQSANIYDSGNYFIIVTDTNGCINTSNSITVQTHPNPNANFLVDGVCFGSNTDLIDSSSINSDAIVNWIWDLGDGSYATGSAISHLYNSTGLFNVELDVISNFGCRDSVIRDLHIFHLPDPSFSFNPFTASILDPSIQFTNTTISAWPVLWDFDDFTFSVEENPLHKFEDPGRYDVMLTVSDTNLCIDSISHQILIDYDFVVYIPTSFTPNGDNLNDIFRPSGFRMNKLIGYEFTIYNAWGGEVFSTNDILDYWDGSNADAGVYTWILGIIDEMGAMQEKSGQVTLIR